MAYSARSDIEAYFGRDNVKKWADLDNNGDETTITARINLAIGNADDLIDSVLRGGPHTIPLTLSPIPKIIVKASVQLAGDDLYTPRGAQDFDEEGRPLHRLRGERADAIESLRKIHSGQLRLLDTAATDSTPTVIDVKTSRDA